MKFHEFFENNYIFKIDNFKDIRGIVSKIELSFDKKIFKNLQLSEILFSTNYKKGTFRGMHYQSYPYSQAKIILCLNGSIDDYVIDLNKNSKFFMKKKKIQLSQKNNKAIFINKGLAHGFLTLENNTRLMYLLFGKYKKNYEKGIRYNDKIINLNIENKIKSISDRDLSFKDFKR